MKINLIENPNNPNRLWIVNADDTSRKITSIGCLYEYQFTRPLKTTDPDPDPLIVQSIKIITGKLTGFETWEEAAEAYNSIEDVEALAAAYGHNIYDLLNR